VSDFGVLLDNGKNSGKKFPKHSAKLKDGSKDDWFAAWDVKNNVFVASARMAARLPARFRHGAPQSLSTQIKTTTHDSQRQLGQGQRIRQRHAQVLCHQRAAAAGREAALFEPRHSASGLSSA
jgi:hypothetical protein